MVTVLNLIQIPQSVALGRNELPLRGDLVIIFVLLIYDIYQSSARILFEVEHICKVGLKAQFSATRRQRLGTPSTTKDKHIFKVGLKGQLSTTRRQRLGASNTIKNEHIFKLGLKAQLSATRWQSLGTPSTTKDKHIFKVALKGQLRSTRWQRLGFSVSKTGIRPERAGHNLTHEVFEI